MSRARGSDQPRFACGPLQFDAGTKLFTLAHEPLSLTPREHAVLRVLIQRSGEPMSKQEILDRVFSDEQDVHLDAIEVIVHRLRKRLHDTVMSVGNTVSADEAFRNFRGRDGQVAAILRDRGFPVPA